MKITNPYGPNTTILLPGGCNAKCSFCFWDRHEGRIKAPNDYESRVVANLITLPKDFSTLSISGGEPTVSPRFVSVMDALRKFKPISNFGRVVLTTNGAKLGERLGDIKGVVDHINISRHTIGTEQNYDVFKTRSVPSDVELGELIERIHSETSCDVTFNCVVPQSVSSWFCFDFIDYAKGLSADAVSFRKEASDVSPTGAEEFFRARYGVDNEANCPVCRGASQTVDGFDVRWKGTVGEPSLDTGGCYEAVIHPDGVMYTDWGMKQVLDTSQLISNMPETSEWPPSLTQRDYYPRASFGGCGSRSGC